MIRLFKVVRNGYIYGFGTNGADSATEITQKEYANLQALFAERPTPPDGYDYLLQDNPLEWVLVGLPPDDPDLDDTEALSILLGGDGE